MSVESDLAKVNAAIDAALKAKRMKQGDDEREMQDLDQLYRAQERLESKLARNRRGMRVTGISLRHN